MKPAHELAEVIEQFGCSFSEVCKPNAYIERILRAIRQCRTSALGGHVDRCNECGHTRISYNSCRNRHCPKCQNTQREGWIADRKQQLLPVPYFHVVFTVPDKLNGLFLINPQGMYNLLFRAAWDTLSQFFLTKLQAESGMTAVLHTWGQNLSLHPHLHCVVPGGGISISGNWKQVKISKNGNVYLFPVENLSAVFRGKFVEALKKLMPVESFLQRELYKNNWVVYTKEPFAAFLSTSFPRASSASVISEFFLPPASTACSSSRFIWVSRHRNLRPKTGKRSAGNISVMIQIYVPFAVKG